VETLRLKLRLKVKERYKFLILSFVLRCVQIVEPKIRQLADKDKVKIDTGL
jgi:hypothetical protein